MGMTTFTGPITAGDIVNTSGTTLGTNVTNVGFVEMVQTVAVTQATNGTTAGLYTTTIVIPAQSQILSIDMYVNVAWTGAASTFNVGTSATATELAIASDNTAVAIGRLVVSPGTNATRVNTWVDVGASDVRVYVLSTNTGSGTGYLTVRYAQAINLVP
jgi:hypothetical protein